MIIRESFGLVIALCLSSACAAAPTPTRAPAPTVSPTTAPRAPTLLLPKPTGNRYAPPDVPACKDARLLNETIRFAWEKTTHVFSNIPENQWTFYRCAQSRAALTVFYRQQMPTPPYHWLETDFEERTEATLVVYNNSPVSVTRGYRWVYLWILPEKSDDQVSYLVAAWWDAYYH